MKPSNLQIGDYFTFVGAFGTYCNLLQWDIDPRGPVYDRVLLFVLNENGRIMSMSLHGGTEVTLVRQELEMPEHDRKKLFELREEHYETIRRLDSNVCRLGRPS